MIEPDSKYCSKIDLSNKGLKLFPEELFELPNLRKLNLRNNKITSIPKNIHHLKLLENLDLSYNRISDLQANIGRLKNLKTLVLNDNQIKTLPKQIGHLNRLDTLMVPNNRLVELPDSISKLAKLRKLNLSGNPIYLFPPQILDLKNLKALWLCNLNLVSFPIRKILNQLDLTALYCHGKYLNDDNVDGLYRSFSRLKGNCISRASSTISLFETPNLKTKHSEPQEMKDKNKIFISYSRSDEKWFKEVMTNLKALKFQKREIKIWSDQKILSGDNWKESIQSALQESGTAVLLVSTNFLASDFIVNEELPVLLKNAKNNGTVILPLIVGHCLFTTDENLNMFQAVNEPSRPLSQLKKFEIEKVLVDLCLDIRERLHHSL